MRLTFWGTRGSLAKPGPETVRYGGNTSCVQIESDSGTLVLLDCGTGAHALGRHLVTRSAQPLRGHLLISHTHWDHIQGMPFFAPLFLAGNTWDIYGPKGFRDSLRESLSGQMQYDYFPVTLDALDADVRYHSLVEGSFVIGDIRVRARYLNHPALTLGYRLEVDGVQVVYSCDHEPHARALADGPGAVTGQDLAHAEFLRDADLVIHDAQYTAAEYPARIGWGHSTMEYACHLCQQAGVKRLALTHHDPNRTDDQLDDVLASLQAKLGECPGIEVFAAREGQTLDLRGVQQPATMDGAPLPSALAGEVLAQDALVLVGLGAENHAQTIAKASAADGIRVIHCRDRDALLQGVRAHAPALVFVDDALQPGIDAITICQEIRGIEPGLTGDLPVIRVGDAPCADACLTDSLTPPFSPHYIRTRIRAWLLRTECRWQPAPIPKQESERLASLHDLGLLDTQPEERFDRITRLATALFDVPIALFSLVDEERQWFKSCIGLDDRQTSREVAFCAHAILETKPLVVYDTVLDRRFADNPLVTGPPHIRFYAGCPLHAPDGQCIGTLCLIDFRPRELGTQDLLRLQDLAALVEREVGASVSA